MDDLVDQTAAAEDLVDACRLGRRCNISNQNSPEICEGAGDMMETRERDDRIAEAAYAKNKDFPRGHLPSSHQPLRPEPGGVGSGKRVEHGPCPVSRYEPLILGGLISSR